MIDASLDFALAFLSAHPNWYIFPITRLEKRPPHILNNLADASNDPKQIKAWHVRWRGCNWGLASRKSGVLVMDVDVSNGKVGQQTLDALTLEYGELPDTLTVRSPSGGTHYYFEGTHQFGIGTHGFGVDLDSPNYVLIPGCWLCSNSVQGYEIVNDVPVAKAPVWFAEILRKKSEKTAEKNNDTPGVDLDNAANVDRMIRYLKEGAPPSRQGSNGDTALYNVVCVLKDNGISESMALQLLVTYYNTPEHCEPVWLVGSGADADRLDVKVTNVYKYAKENKAGSATAEWQFGDPDDAVDPAEVVKLNEAWIIKMAELEPRREAKLAEKKESKAFADQEAPETEQREKAEQYFAQEYDPLTGEAIDPATGEPYPEDNPPPDDEPSPPANPPPPPPEGGDDPKPKDQKDSPDPDPNSDGGADVPKNRQKLPWVRANWVWIVGSERFIRLRDGVLWNTRQFDSYYNNLAKGKASFSSGLFATDLIPKAERYIYRPGKGVMLEDGRLINGWRPSPIVPKQGDTNIWNEHMNWLFQNEEDCNLVLNWMAWVYQNIDKKPNHALLIVGQNTGTGKSFIARIMEKLVGADNTQRPKNSSLKGDFNAWANMCKLCIIEELMQIGRREVANELRDTITESTIEVNVKNITAQKIENYMAMMAISNHRDAMPMEDTERRWLVVETLVKKRDEKYYREKLWPILDNEAALSAIAYELKNRDLKGYSAAYSPKETQARANMIDMSRSDSESWLYENKGSGVLARNLVRVDDVIEAMPVVSQKQTRLRNVVQAFLRDKCNGEVLRAVRLPNGDRVRLWAINGKAVLYKQMNDAQIADKWKTEREQGARSEDSEGDIADFQE